ncbi:D-Ala-D-Ala carboxypeptidase family metallohydrolase [uncultured Methanobrevibacter sp.]|uniref:D-Ala-D-Ala carboxypeptidase family metallohydrolase n=1 Tax=uncultured Methanobrevibacter sp. TaxID=253161 RepID=UPI0025FD21D3|nr:D-Ala-D-Ala carboxypeptidase family metallohydrolase [uncultured Methanobrevibacter sp.]
MEKITANFALDELIYSPTANRLGIDNTPDKEIKEKLIRLAKEILQPIRNKWGSAVVVTSAYRCEALNKAVGGSKTSQHRLGEAADIKVGSKAQNKALFNLIQKMVSNGELKVGQLIDEYGYSWVHVSLPRTNGKPNNQILHLK